MPAKIKPRVIVARVIVDSCDIPGGGMSVDIEALVVALITVWKAAHMDKAQVIADFGLTWDEVEVETRVPGTGRA